MGVKFRGIIGPRVLDKPSFEGRPPRTHAEKYELDVAKVQRIGSRLNGRPMRDSHQHTNIGCVLRNWLDDHKPHRRWWAQFEIDDPDYVDALRSGKLTQLSLQHLMKSLIPIEVSLCEKPVREGSAITHELCDRPDECGSTHENYIDELGDVVISAAYDLSELTIEMSSDDAKMDGGASMGLGDSLEMPQDDASFGGSSQSHQQPAQLTPEQLQQQQLQKQRQEEDRKRKELEAKKKAAAAQQPSSASNGSGSRAGTGAPSGANKAPHPQPSGAAAGSAAGQSQGQGQGQSQGKKSDMDESDDHTDQDAATGAAGGASAAQKGAAAAAAAVAAEALKAAEKQREADRLVIDQLRKDGRLSQKLRDDLVELRLREMNERNMLQREVDRLKEENAKKDKEVRRFQGMAGNVKDKVAEGLAMLLQPNIRSADKRAQDDINRFSNFLRTDSRADPFLEAMGDTLISACYTVASGGGVRGAAEAEEDREQRKRMAMMQHLEAGGTMDEFEWKETTAKRPPMQRAPRRLTSSSGTSGRDGSGGSYKSSDDGFGLEEGLQEGARHKHRERGDDGDGDAGMDSGYGAAGGEGDEKVSAAHTHSGKEEKKDHRGGHGGSGGKKAASWSSDYDDDLRGFPGDMRDLIESVRGEELAAMAAAAGADPLITMRPNGQMDGKRRRHGDDGY